MMKIVKKLSYVIIAMTTSIAVNAQQPATPNTSLAQGGPGAFNPMQPMDVYVRDNIVAEKDPIPYSHLREADVSWSKDIWRYIDMRQRQNYSIRYPIYDVIGNRASLYNILSKGINIKEITPYEFGSTKWNTPFSTITTEQEIAVQIEQDTTKNPNTGEILNVNRKENEVVGYYIQEKWYFDKKYSEMRVRINAIVPKFVIYNQRTDRDEPKIPYAVYFPECRKLFSQYAIYNQNNDAQAISYDDFFMQRRFASTITAESNVFENRNIFEFLTGEDILLEAERIKDEIFKKEHDFWEY